MASPQESGAACRPDHHVANLGYQGLEACGNMRTDLHMDISQHLPNGSRVLIWEVGASLASTRHGNSDSDSRSDKFLWKRTLGTVLGSRLLTNVT
jgi:hypothetical protein